MRSHQIARRIGISAALIAAAGLAGISPGSAFAATSAATCANWTGTAPVNPTSELDVFDAVATPSPCSAWAVGNYKSSGVYKTLVEHWNGTHWTFMLSASPGGFTRDSFLTGVTAARGAKPWAVGYYNNGIASQTVIESPKNGLWLTVPSPDPGGPHNDNVLTAVAATSATRAWAVGWYSTGASLLTLVERWNGTSWRQVPSPNPGAGNNELYGVAAISAKDAWAVGLSTNSQGQAKTLILHWNGASWKRVRSPNPAAQARLNSVTETSASNAWAVGEQTNNGTWQPLAEHWNGRSWKSVRAPSPSPNVPSLLYGVTATSPGSAWAVGYSGASGAEQTLIEHWNGRTWRRTPSPSPGTAALLFGVASSRTSIWAVGYYGSSFPLQTLAVHCC